MARIENHGMIFRVGMDRATIDDTAYCQIITGRADLAFELLTSTYCTPEQAKNAINNTKKNMLEMAEKAKQKASAAAESEAGVEEESRI